MYRFNRMRNSEEMKCDTTVTANMSGAVPKPKSTMYNAP